MVEILVGRLKCILSLVHFNVVGRLTSVWFVGLQKFLQKNFFCLETIFTLILFLSMVGLVGRFVYGRFGVVESM